MDFKVVDIPDTNPTGSAAPIIVAMLENVGKAIEVPLNGRDANNLRKLIRSSLIAKNRIGTVGEYDFHTKVNTEQTTITVWLQPKAKE